MIVLGTVPDGIDAINDVYGCPDKDDNFHLDPDFFDTKICIYKLPFPLRLSWKPHVITKYIQCHKDISAALLDVFHEIGQYRGVDWLRDNGKPPKGGYPGLSAPQLYFHQQPEVIQPLKYGLSF